MRELPDGWEYRRVDQVGDIQLGRQRSPAMMTGQYMRPYLRVANVLDGYIDYSDVLEMNFSPHEAQTFGLQPGDILLNEGQALDLVGRCAVFNGPPGMCFQNTLLRFRPRAVLPKFAAAVFKHWLDHGEFRKITRQTTSIAHLGFAQFTAMHFPYAPLQEEHRIAEILDSADDQIRRTEQIVAKLRVQKSGLLQQIIGEESTKNSPYRVGDALLGIDAGWSPLCDEEPPSGDRWGVLKVSAVTSGRYIPGESKTLLAGLIPRPEIEVKNGDVIMCRANGAKELVGAVAMIRDTPPKLMLSDKTLRLIANTAVVNPAYLCHFMESWTARKQIGELLSGSSGQNNISQKFIRSMRMPIPDLPRQLQIVEALSVAENRIEAERSFLEGLRRLKQGLVDDLLMGRIRVAALYFGIEFFQGSGGLAVGTHSFQVYRRASHVGSPASAVRTTPS